MMDPERWRRIKKLFAQAVDLAPDQRAKFLAKACGDDANLQSEVTVSSPPISGQIDCSTRIYLTFARLACSG